jgi:hypothetical protein
MRRAILALALILFTAATAQAVTLKDIVDLSKAGLSDEVLLALIEVDGGVFNIDTSTLTQLKTAGVSQKVIVALVRSGRERPPVQPEPQALSQVVAQQQAAQIAPVEPVQTTIVREVVVPYPVYVGVPAYVGVPSVGRSHRGGVPTSSTVQPLQPSITAPPEIHGPTQWLTDTPKPQKQKKEEPVYWGWGGKLRPDAWKPQ